MYSIATLEIRYLSLVAAEDPKMAMFLGKQRINQGFFLITFFSENPHGKNTNQTSLPHFCGTCVVLKDDTWGDKRPLL
jgi:hypothetical protein